MRVVLQRVSRASVAVDDRPIAEIGEGALLLVAAGADDADGEPERLAEKTARLRVFRDDEGRMNRSIADVAGEALVVSQFTLYADVRRGRRPSWAGAAPPEVAEGRVDAYARALEALGVPVARGRFGADMQVELVNDGPVTILLDARDL